MKNNTLYRLEFNFEQQQFHLDNYTHDENTHGWETICESCTDFEFKIFEAFINRVNKEKFTIHFLKTSLSELKSFTKNLLEYNIAIQQL